MKVFDSCLLITLLMATVVVPIAIVAIQPEKIDTHKTALLDEASSRQAVTFRNR